MLSVDHAREMTKAIHLTVGRRKQLDTMMNNKITQSASKSFDVTDITEHDVQPFLDSHHKYAYKAIKSAIDYCEQTARDSGYKVYRKSYNFLIISWEKSLWAKFLEWLNRE